MDKETKMINEIEVFYDLLYNHKISEIIKKYEVPLLEGYPFLDETEEALNTYLNFSEWSLTYQPQSYIKEQVEKGIKSSEEYEDEEEYFICTSAFTFYDEDECYLIDFYFSKQTLELTRITIFE